MSNETNNSKISIGIVRIVLGLYMLWAFLDKAFGLGFTTEKSAAWINGGSPTTGFLKFGAAEGPFRDIFIPLSGQVWVDWAFMIGLLGIGVALILGVGVRIAGISGIAMMTLMYIALLPIKKGVAHNPLIDEHIIYGSLFLYFALNPDAGKYIGLGKKWGNINFVVENPILV